MKLYENVYVIPRDSNEPTLNSEQRKCLGLYEGNTDKAILEGGYYCYLTDIEEKFNYYWTGRSLRYVDKIRAIPINLSVDNSEPPIFGGYIDSHFGHFFIEVLARGIDFKLHKNHSIVFLLFRDHARSNLTLFYKLCAFFGLDKNQIIIIDEPTTIANLYVPEPQFFISEKRIKRANNSEYAYIDPDASEKYIPANRFSDKFLEIHRKKGDTITTDENTVDKILYLSCIKSKLFFGERIIHQVLEEQGQTVICPEEHSWETVISLVRKHKHVVGLRGSAMHFLMFCRKQKKVTYFANATELSHNFHNLEQMLQNNYEYVQVRLIGIKNRPETNNLFVFEDIVALLKILGIEGISNNYSDIYTQIITRNHIKYWQKHI
jgi:hypothetical protein